MISRRVLGEPVVAREAAHRDPVRGGDRRQALAGDDHVGHGCARRRTPRPRGPTSRPASIPPRCERRTSAPLLGCPTTLSGARRVPCREALLCVLQAAVQRYRRRVKAVHIGCSGWNYAEWRGLVYPEGLPQRRWLEHYATLFDTVEVNATFYRLPKRETVEHWLEVAPEGFEFAIKASRYLTHIKRLREMPKYLPRLLERLEPLLGTPKMGPMLWQLPESFQRDDERLAAALPAFGPCRNAIEFRHRAGSASRCTSCCASTASRSCSATIPSAPSVARADRGLDLHPPALRGSRPARQLLARRARDLAPADRRLARRARGLPVRQQRLGGLLGQERDLAEGPPVQRLARPARPSSRAPARARSPRGRAGGTRPRPRRRRAGAARAPWLKLDLDPVVDRPRSRRRPSTAGRRAPRRASPSSTSLGVLARVPARRRGARSRR